MNEDTSAEDMAREALTPSTFSFANALRGRAYPTEDVEIYLDETLVYPLLAAMDKITAADKRLDLIAKDDENVADLLRKFSDQRDEAIAERDAIKAEISASKYIVKITGVSSGADEDSLNEALETHPRKFVEKINVTTGALDRVEEENPLRDRLYTNKLWQSRIVSITAPDGAVQSGEQITLDLIAEMRRDLPAAARNAIEVAMDKTAVAVSWYDVLADEVFLAKP